MNERLSTLQTAFNQKLLAAAKAGALHVADPAALAGLSPQQLAAAQEDAKSRKLSGYVLPLQNTTQQPALADLTSHATRQQLLDASLNRAEHGDANDTRNVISEIAQLRAKKAALLGYPTYADYTLYDQMAKDRTTAVGFLDRLAAPTAAKERWNKARYGYADLADVTTRPKKQSDHCPGYWWSEQMKYYYLIFSDTPRVDYRKLYLSTEGNVLRGLRRR
jgi:peptidyl-dipeptidase Dcp